MFVVDIKLPVQIGHWSAESLQSSTKVSGCVCVCARTHLLTLFSFTFFPNFTETWKAVHLRLGEKYLQTLQRYILCTYCSFSDDGDIDITILIEQEGRLSTGRANVITASTNTTFLSTFPVLSIHDSCVSASRQGSQAALLCGGKGSENGGRSKVSRHIFTCRSGMAQRGSREGQKVVWAHNKEFTNGWKWGLYCWPMLEGLEGGEEKWIFFGAEFKKHSTQQSWTKWRHEKDLQGQFFSKNYMKNILS